MCGSGTIAIEAALIAADRAPGLGRTFGFQKLMWFDGPPWQRMKQAARDRIVAPPSTPQIFASDIAPGAAAKAQANLRAAQVDAFVAVEVADLLVRGAPVAAGTLLTNPPYGVRLDDLDRLAKFYPLLGDTLKQRFAGWTAYFFTGDLRLPKLIYLKVARKTPLYNGALECRLFEFPLVAGRHERPA
jgi:putative N6-adenine-specific DNA methylase